jgi:HPt (histidine-containing phosphotransfer) domain-containing protein
VLALTASGFEADRKACLDAGMNGFLTKPVEPEQLFAELARWIPQLAVAAPVASPAAAGPEILIDRQAGLKFSGGNVERYRQLLAKFADLHAADGGKIMDALAAGDSEAARLLAHSLKGVCATLGMESARMRAASLEQKIRDGTTVPALAPCLEELSAILVQLAFEIAVPEPDPGPESPSAQAALQMPPLELMARLDSQLASDDFQATDTWLRLRATVAASAGTESAATIERQIEAYDFAEARATLRSLRPPHA